MTDEQRGAKAPTAGASTATERNGVDVGRLARTAEAFGREPRLGLLTLRVNST